MASFSNYRCQIRKERPNHSTNNGDMAAKANCREAELLKYNIHITIKLENLLKNIITFFPMGALGWGGRGLTAVIGSGGRGGSSSERGVVARLGEY